MGYALFAQRKLVLNSQLNSTQLQQTQRSNTQFKLATDVLGLEQDLASLSTSQAQELAILYQELAQCSDEAARGKVQADIEKLKLQHQAEQDAINREIYTVGVKEAAIEMEVKHLDTMVTKLQKELEAVEEAEGKAIDRATPKFNGLG